MRRNAASLPCWSLAWLLAAALGNVVAGVADDEPVTASKLRDRTPAYFPPPESQGGWRTLTDPDAIRNVAGMDPQKLEELRKWLRESDRRGFAAVLIRRGYVVLQEERGNSATNDSRRIASCSKAVCATVLAIASEQSQQGLTPRKMRFDDRAFDFIPWAQPLSDPRKAAITVKQLLNHTSGLCPEAVGAPNDGTWDYILGHTRDPRTEKLAFDPGTACGYSTHALAHAALVCENVTGKPYDAFAIEALFKPLGIEHWWFQYYNGGPQVGRHPSHGLGMPARDMARIAYCMLRDGRWNDRQVVPKWFVEQTAAPTHDVMGPELRFKINAQTFSHGWELPARLTGEGGRSGRGIPADARFKPGSGGQLIAFVPSLDLVVTRQTGESGSWDYDEFLRRACAAVIEPPPPQTRVDAPVRRTILGTRASRFTINGTPTFLLGISHYGALGEKEDDLGRDLDALQRHGFNWLRVWATWSAFDHDVSAVDAQGRARSLYLDRLKELVAECDRRGLIVDITLTRRKGADHGALADFEAHQRAVATVLGALAPHRNWYLDLANERDVNDARFVPIAELKTLREQVRRLDPERLVTASFGGHDLSDDDVDTSTRMIGLDFLAPHRPRNPRSPRETMAHTRAAQAALQKLGQAAPILYQEPFRRGYTDWQPTAADFLDDLQGALAGGAAGWCLHNGSQRGTKEERPRRSFDLRDGSLLDQLDPVEREVVSRAATLVRTSAKPALPGAIRAPKGSRWLERGGRPILLVGDSLTQGWMELGADFDQDAYLHALASRGINATLIWSFVGVVDQARDARIGYDAHELWPWPRREGRFDLNASNPLYFQRLHSFVEHAGSKGIAVVITVHDGWTKTRFEGHPFHIQNGGWLARKSDYVRLGRPEREMPLPFDPAWNASEKHQFVLERFSAALVSALDGLDNVAYEMFNEGEWYDRPSWSSFQRHFLEFFQRRTPQPLLVNDDHRHGREFLLDPRADAISLHMPNWGGRSSSRLFFDHHQRHFDTIPPKPFLFSETVPEYTGESELTAAVPRLLWGTALAGTGVLLQNDTSWGFAPRSAIARARSAGETVLDLEGHLARFLNSGAIDLARMQPRGALASTGVCLAAEGEAYLAFLDAGTTAVDLDLRDAPNRRFSVTWYNPWTGEAQAAASLKGGEATTRLTSPFDRDAVVHLKRMP
ncbi:MAG: serine hydrolase [Isosphaeraceae bacterium]